MQKLGQTLKTCREKERITQSTLSKQLHVSRKTISNWENDRSEPDFQTLVQLSNFYRISTDDLLRGHIKKDHHSSMISYYLNIGLLLLIYANIFVTHPNLINACIAPLLTLLNIGYFVFSFRKWSLIIRNQAYVVNSLILTGAFLIISLMTYISVRSSELYVTFHANAYYRAGGIMGMTTLMLIIAASFFITLIKLGKSN